MFALGTAEMLLSNENYGNGFMFWINVIGYVVIAISCGVAAVLCVITTCKDAKEFKKKKRGL